MRLFLIFSLLIYSELLFGQSGRHHIEITYGVGKSNIENHTILHERYEPLPANSLKVAYQFGFSNLLSISTGVAVEQRGGQFISFEREILGEGPPFLLGNTILRNNKNEFAYIAIPLTLNYNLYSKQKLGINIALGSYYSFLVKQLWNFDYSDKFSLVENNVLQFNYKSNDYGLSAGLGVSYQISKSFGLILGYQFQKGLKDVFRDENIEGYHIRNSVAFGMRFNIL